MDPQPHDIKLTLLLGSDIYFPGEPVTLEYILVNQGPGPVLLSDPSSERNRYPLYRLTGPEFPEGAAFNRSGREGAKATVSVDTTPDVLSLKPGQSYTGSIDLTDYIRPAVPGVYRLEVVYPAPSGGLLTAWPVSWTVDRLGSVSGGLIPNPGTEYPLEVSSVWRAKGEAADVLFRRFHAESSFEEWIVETRWTERVARLGPEASDPVGSARAHVALDEQMWLAWLEGAMLCASTRKAPELLRLELPAAGRLVRPGLVLPSEDLEAFVLGQDAKLRLVRFHRPVRIPAEPVDLDLENAIPWEEASKIVIPSEGDGEAPDVTVEPPRLAGEWDFPDAPQGIAAALGPPEARSERRLAYTVQRDGGVEVVHIAFEDGPRRVARAWLPDAALLPQTDPALAIDARGVSHVAVLHSRLAGAAGEAAELYVGEVRFDPEGRVWVSAQQGLTELGPLESAPRAGVVAIHLAPDAPPAREYAVLTEDGRVWAGKFGKGLRLTALRDPVVPLELLFLGDRAFLAMQSRASGLELAYLY